jgi:hypothetical protein
MSPLVIVGAAMYRRSPIITPTGPHGLLAEMWGTKFLVLTSILTAHLRHDLVVLVRYWFGISQKRSYRSRTGMGST